MSRNVKPDSAATVSLKPVWTTSAIFKKVTIK